MENLTISKLGEIKTVSYTNKKTNQPESFQKVGFQANEYPERWVDLTWFKGACPISVGQSYDVDLETREYNGKTYWQARLPKKTDQNNKELLIKLEMVFRELVAIRETQLRIFNAVVDTKVEAGSVADMDFSEVQPPF